MQASHNISTTYEDENDIEPEVRSRRKTKGNQKVWAVSTRWEREQEEGGRRKKVCTGTSDDLHNICCCCARRVGSMFFLCERRDGTPLIVAGPCWPFCTFVTLPLILGLSILTLYFCIFKNDEIPIWVAYIYVPIIALTLFTLFMVSCRDPGMMERVTDAEAGNGTFLWNEQVGSYRPPNALYCRECQVIIEDYDHLCPWTGTSIGKKNMFCFKAFVALVNILCYGSIGIVAYVLLK